jgi:3-oxoacyl-[acyl-carrier protein] reductase
MKGNSVLITGGSSGIGAATARHFAREGCDVCISYRKNESSALAVVEELKKFKVRAISVSADLGNEQDAQNLVASTLKEFGKLDVLVNNAGGYIDGDEWNGESEVWQESLSKNLLSVMNVSKYAIRHFMERKSGIIISVASRHARSGQYDALAYAAAKSGIVNITEAYAKLLSPWGRANAVSPGTVRAGYWLNAPREELDANLAETPLGKLMEPEDIADAILF